MNQTPKNRRNIENTYNFRDKVGAVQYFVDTMLNRTLTMFHYEGLPKSLPERELEKILQINGYGIVTEHNGELVSLWGGWAPPLNVYYQPTKVLVNNPWANINKEFTIGEDCILMRNDPLYTGLMPILEKYGSAITETDLTLYLAMINYRAIYNITASTDSEKDSAELFLKRIEEGTQGVLLDEDMSNGIKTQPYSQGSSGYITQIIELEQYLRGTFLNEIGLNANYNMKRERLSANETELNEDSLRPLIDSMLEERQKAVKEINEKYGTNITVEFNSAWSKYNISTEEMMLIKSETEESVSDDEVVSDESNKIMERDDNDERKEKTD